METSRLLYFATFIKIPDIIEIVSRRHIDYITDCDKRLSPKYTGFTIFEKVHLTKIFRFP